MENEKRKAENIAMETTTTDTQDNILKEQLHVQSLNVLKRLPAMGPVIMLYLQSPHRRYQFISDLEWLLLPPLVSGQCKLYMKKEYPISFVSWAFLDETAEKRLLQNGGKLRPQDWKSGEQLWIIDIVAPFGGIDKMIRDVQQNEFPDKTIRLIAPDPKTGGITARELPAYSSEKENVKHDKESVHH